MCVGERRTTIATSCYRSDVVIEPIKQQPTDTMARFDKLVMCAAKKKKKDIINRYDQEAFEKRVAKLNRKEKKEDPEFIKKDYESTIRELYASVGQTPPEKPKPLTINIDEIVEKSSKLKFTKSPNPKNRRKRMSSRRQSLPDGMNLQLPSIDDSFSSKESIKKEEKSKRRARSKSPGKLKERSSRSKSPGKNRERKSRSRSPAQGMERTCRSQSPGVHRQRRANFRSSRRKSVEEAIDEANRIIAIEDMEREVDIKKGGYRQRRGSFGSSMDNCDNIIRSPHVREAAIQDMEREVILKKEGYRQRRGSFGSSMDNCDDITKNVREAVDYWEEATPTPTLRRLTQPQRRLSVH